MLAIVKGTAFVYGDSAARRYLDARRPMTVDPEPQTCVLCGGAVGDGGFCSCDEDMR